MFEQASKMKIRFGFSAGTITTEDLWDLPLSSLDTLAIDLSRSIKDTEEVSFISTSRRDEVLELKFSIVKHVIQSKLKLIADDKSKAETKAKKEKIMSLIASKEDDSLKEMSSEDLEKMLNSL